MIFFFFFFYFLILKKLNDISKKFNILLSKYDNFMLISDLNETTAFNFYGTCNLKHLIKVKRCFKNHTKPTCIDLIATSDQNASKIQRLLKQDYQIFTR